MPASVKIAPRHDYVKKDGTSALYLTVTIDRKIKRYQLPYYVDPTKWDDNRGQFKGTSPLACQVNTYVLDQLSRANSILIEIQNNKRNLNFKEFEVIYLNKSDRNDFYAFVDQHIADNVGKCSEIYLKQLKGEKTKLQKFRPKLSFQEIDRKFLIDYEQYMRVDLGNKTNTVYKTFKRLKTIIHEAMRQDPNLLRQSPFAQYKLHQDPVNRMHLSREELEKLYSMRNEFSGKVFNVVNYFLFSCYTGLRYQDIKDLQWKNIQGDHIALVMHKTLEQIIIPLIDRSQELLPDRGRPDESVFQILSNQKTNDYLKLAIEKAGINKNISFHCARHTFATVALNSDIPLEVVQKLLGHSMIRTTQIYAKIVNKTIFEQMKKME
ncbi:Tyrosine recombinase XerD [bioreactor metagenome]|uniref:Tyrosine recombinase XerD n=1 Tax=bioreactor metagenome TaxID=1076179 RepID=A0A644X1U7_9ZZZZ